MTSQTHLPIVSLKFSLADDPRTHIKEWHEDLCAKAYGLCPQWDITGAITLIADDAYWNAMSFPGPTLEAWPGPFTIWPGLTTPPSLMPQFPCILPVSPLSVLPYRKQSTGAHLPLPRSRSKSARCSPTLGTRSRPPRFIATMKSRWVWLIRPSSLRCRSPATCDFIGCRSEFVGSSSGSSTFAAYPTCRITSPSLCP